MQKACKTCKFSKTIKYNYHGFRKHNIPYEALFCIVGPPSANTSFKFKDVSLGFKTLSRYYNYPKVTNTAPCALYHKKTTKELAELEEISKKEKAEAAEIKQQKKIEQEILKKKRKEKQIIAAACIVARKEEKEAKKKEKERKKKKAEYQKKYQEKKLAEKLKKIEEAEDFDRFEILDL